MPNEDALCASRRYKLGVTSLIGILPGTRDRDIQLSLDSFIGLIADELELINADGGFRVKDASRDQYFSCKAQLVHLVSDHKALEKLFKVGGYPRLWACLKCWFKGFKVLSHVFYVGHYVFLRVGHTLRSRLKALNTEPGRVVTGNELPPARRTTADLMQLLQEPQQRTQPRPQEPTLRGQVPENGVLRALAAAAQRHAMAAAAGVAARSAEGLGDALEADGDGAAADTVALPGRGGLDEEDGAGEGEGEEGAGRRETMRRRAKRTVAVQRGKRVLRQVM